MNTDKILIVAATLDELQPSIAFLEQNDIDYLITGVGMLATSYALTKYIAQKPVDIIINVGIGGILDPEASLGGVYQITEDHIYEFGAEDKDSFISIERLGFGKFTYQERLPDSYQNMLTDDINKAIGITVNKVHGSEKSILTLRQTFPISTIESMEGAAVFYIAEQEKVNCLQFRCTSNYIEPRNRDSWKIKPAIENLNSFLQCKISHFF